MSSTVRGFPERFPVRDDDRRSVRYRIASALGRAYLGLLSRRTVRIEGEHNLPVTGPLLVACNHISNLDPIVFGARFPLTLSALAKREMYVNGFVAWFLAGCNCIPIDRSGADRAAVRRALDVLRRRGRLLVFLEGTRSRDGTMHRAEAGIGFLARHSGAAVIPAALTGTDRLERERHGLLRRRRIVLRYGEPFTLALTGRRDDAAIADEIATRVAALLPVDRRGVYAADTTP